MTNCGYLKSNCGYLKSNCGYLKSNCNLIILLNTITRANKFILLICKLNIKLCMVEVKLQKN